MCDGPDASERPTHLSRRRVLALGGAGISIALAGCGSASETPTPRPAEATVTIRLSNRDDQPREYEVTVNQGERLTDSFSGVLPSDQSVEMVATFRVTEDQHDFSITTTGGQRGRTWEPTECAAFSVDAFIHDGSPGFETECRSN